MIDPIIECLKKGQSLLTNITEIEYNDKSVAPYHSSIGGHSRHVLDVFYCVFLGLDSGHVYLNKRPRNIETETIVSKGVLYYEEILEGLISIKQEDLVTSFLLTDDLGNGPVTVSTTLAAILAQAHNHAIHHFATIGYLLHYLGINLPDNSFGVNPTTPQMVLVSSNR